MDKIELFKRCLQHTISTDTRDINDQDVFIALSGENFDGNSYCHKALENGATFCISDSSINQGKENIYVVPNSLEFLQELANYKRKALSIPFIGITGSNGKTTNKELIHAVLSTKYKTAATKGNFNNHIGVPLTLLDITEDIEISIVEMGANQPNDIIELAEIAEPNYAIITNIGAAHLEGFGNLQGVLKTKKQLFDFVERNSDSTIVYNADDPTVSSIVPLNVNVFPFGSENDLRVIHKKSTPFLEFTYQYKEYTSPPLNTKLIGDYNINNFMAAVSFGILFEVPFDLINDALENYTPNNNRSQLTTTEKNKLIVDCYNANPTSMTAAVNNIDGIEHANRICILGDMLELGTESSTEHQKVIQLVESTEINTFYVGSEFYKESNGKSNFYLDTKSLIDSGELELIKDGIILLKGSRGIKLEDLIDLL